ncbi:MAG: peptidoglycan DD-metalloendopeptidase family protein [Actinobacteria bacterium]|nr:peptidoglycan DD-metalloendopeptidase family protein [Actinomycetota bacterium]
MTKIRIVLVLVLLALFGAQVAPAGADPRAEREKARERKAQLARELDGLQASEDELNNALRALDEQMLAQAAEVDGARQAVAAAEAEVAEAERQVAETGQRIDGLTEAVVQRAVESFIRPAGDPVEDMVQSRDITEAARKRALLAQVAARDDDVIDELNAAQEDFEVSRAQADAARVKADERRGETEGRLAELATTREEKARLARDLEVRATEVSDEIAAQARSEAELTRIIAEAEARAAAEARRRQASRSSGSAAGIVGVTSDGRVGGGGCIWPTRGTVTSGFGNRWGRLHAGIDVAAPTGTPIWAAKAGTVIFAGQQGGYGNVVIISHGGGLTTLYGHQSKISTSQGQEVAQGDTIGAVGNTGRSTGPHLHFETRYGGSPRDPRGCLP